MVRVQRHFLLPCFPHSFASFGPHLKISVVEDSVYETASPRPGKALKEKVKGEPWRGRLTRFSRTPIASISHRMSSPGLEIPSLLRLVGTLVGIGTERLVRTQATAPRRPHGDDKPRFQGHDSRDVMDSLRNRPEEILGVIFLAQLSVHPGPHAQVLWVIHLRFGEDPGPEGDTLVEIPPLPIANVELLPSLPPGKDLMVPGREVVDDGVAEDVIPGPSQEGCFGPPSQSQRPAEHRSRASL